MNYDNQNCRSVFSLCSVSLDNDQKEPQTIKIVKKKKKDTIWNKNFMY